MSAASNPDAGRERIAVLAETIELSLNHPHDPIRSLDRIGWAVSIRSEMPWLLPSDIDAAAVLLEQRYWLERP